jgi:hypothetical protein
MDDLSEFFEDFFNDAGDADLQKIDSLDQLLSTFKERDSYCFSSMEDSDILSHLDNFLSQNSAEHEGLNPLSEKISFGGGLGICNIKCLNDENPYVSATNREDY